MYNPKPYTGSTTKLVVAFDIGATFTGISYCLLEPGRVPEVLGVARFPAQELARGDAKVPSLLYYDQSGNLKAAGAEVLSESTNETALEEGWVKAEWWKLHLRQGHESVSSLDLGALPPLPPGKSALDLLVDFIRYIFECARTYIKERHLAFTWPTIEDSIEYIFTHPNGWEGSRQQQYRQAAERAGLVPSTPQGQARVHLLTEGEASLHFCVPMLLTTTDTSPRGVVVIDAGGATVDLSMYLMTVNPISCKEIAVSEGRLQGSAFVTFRATALLRKKLQGWDHSSEEEIKEFASEFDHSTKLVIKSDRELAYIRVAGRRYNNSKYNISLGRLMLTGKEATGLFNASYDAIIDAFEIQLRSATMPIATIFLVGGLSTNDWLWSRLKLYFEERKIDIYRSDDHANKAVANGAVMSYVNHLVCGRVARDTYGVVCALSVDDKDEQHIQRRDEWEMDKTGDFYVPGYFEVMLLKGTQIREEMESRVSFSLLECDPKDFGIQPVRLVRYRGELSHPIWLDRDEPSFFISCTIYADLRETFQDLVVKKVLGHVYYQLDYDVIILLGLAEVRAYLVWKTREGERRIPVTTSYAETGEYSNSYTQGVEKSTTVSGFQPRKKASTPQRPISKELCKHTLVKEVDPRVRKWSSDEVLKFPHECADEMRSLRAVIRAHERKHKCEVLYAQGHTSDAAFALVEIINTANAAVRANRLLADWLAEFTNRCVSKLETTGDEALGADKHDEAVRAYSIALFLSDSILDTLLTKWANTVLARESADDALAAATKFQHPKFFVFRAICDALEAGGRVVEAVACFWRMENELVEDISALDEQAQWEPDFQRRCRKRLENLSDEAMKSGHFKEAAEYLSTVLSLKPENCVNVLIKRSRARASMKSWDEALNDAEEVIDLSPSSHHGYELKHAALHGARRFAEAVEAFGTMLLKLKGSLDEGDHEYRYVDPRPVIQSIVESVIRPTPRMLIDTVTGCLYDKQQQMGAFKELPIYNELVSSMMRKLDEAWIRKVVEEFYRYVMFSHRWGEGEPLLQDVKNISIYDLKSSPGSMKLQRFCPLARDRGFRWAWSDTCCIDKDNNVILQESLVSMFKWYRGSSLTIVHLLGVPSAFQHPGGLRESIWNSRGWTYQEYVAAKTVLFYTEDWQPYHGLEVPNHKESSVIISEMQQVTGDTTSEIAVVQPGLDRVREKLYLASMRRTTLEEDAAYSLFGIFNASLPVIYGEGDHAVGRLLDHVLNGSGDVSILAWTGTSGSYNSCLPRDLRVYDRIVPPHIPLPMEKAEMDRTTNKLRLSLSDLSILMKLHKRLNKLPLPSVSASRLKLPGIVCSVTNLVQMSESPEAGQRWRVYHAKTSMFGDIEIRTGEDLTGMQDLCLVHPWIRPLLDQEHSESGAGLDKTTRALRLVSRLKQPFGALLLWSLSRVEHRRVAVDSLIMTRMDEVVSLEELIECIRTIEIQ